SWQASRTARSAPSGANTRVSAGAGGGRLSNPSSTRTRQVEQRARPPHTLGADFCVEALEEALAHYGNPEIFNTDQGCQFTSTEFTGVLERRAITISMDGRGRCMDNIFIERLWRSLKYEEVYLHAYTSVVEAKAG